MSLEGHATQGTSRIFGRRFAQRFQSTSSYKLYEYACKQ